MSAQLFAVIFEGRSGSSELIARLNSHPDIQAYPEVLAPLAHSGAADVRWFAVDHVFAQLRDGLDLDTFHEKYSKLVPAHEVSIRGFKTRLNEADDQGWYEAMGVPQHFYCVEPDRFVELALTYGTRVIYLRRRDLLRHAISWLRAIELATRRQIWNITRGDTSLGPLPIDIDRLEFTLTWLARAKRRHAAAFDAYRGPKLAVDYEDLVGRSVETEADVLRFLGARPSRLEPFHAKVTDHELEAVVPNLPDVLAAAARLGVLPHGPGN